MMMIAQPWQAFDWWEYVGKPWQLRLMIDVFFFSFVMVLFFVVSCPNAQRVGYSKVLVFYGLSYDSG